MQRDGLVWCEELSAVLIREGLSLIITVSNYGVVRRVKIIEGRGFGFVEMSNQSEAERAKEALDYADFKGRVLRVDETRPLRIEEERDHTRY